MSSESFLVFVQTQVSFIGHQVKDHSTLFRGKTPVDREEGFVPLIFFIFET